MPAADEEAVSLCGDALASLRLAGAEARPGDAAGASSASASTVDGSGGSIEGRSSGGGVGRRAETARMLAEDCRLGLEVVLKLTAMAQQQGGTGGQDGGMAVLPKERIARAKVRARHGHPSGGVVVVGWCSSSNPRADPAPPPPP